MKITYVEKNFRPLTLERIEQANVIIEQYQAEGYTLTLRQLYYQFVARGIIKNEQCEYDKLGSIINDARLAGLVDWDAIEDRTRWLRERPSWRDPAEIVDGCAQQFHIDPWLTQDYAPEVWIEKDALIGVIEPICDQLSVPYFACRGYVSQSELHRAGRRWRASTRRPIVFHLGDHDPSGLDMTRDNDARGQMFSDHGVVFERLALSIHQVERFNPPPNPTKLSDSRASGYVVEYGTSSWELDALEPSYISQLVEKAVRGLIEPDAWAEAEELEREGREVLEDIALQLEEGTD